MIRTEIMLDPRLSVEVEIEVPFHDVDSMHVVWHGNYIKYFEIARTKLARLLKYDLHEMLESSVIWPIVECKCRYIQSVSYGDIIIVKAWITEIEYRLKINYLIVKKEGGERLTKGSTTQVAVDRETGRLIDTTVLQDSVKSYLKKGL
jgi:acyl-CoA thioester hydrolase